MYIPLTKIIKQNKFLSSEGRKRHYKVMNMVFIFYTSYKVQMNITKFMGKYLIYTIAFEDIRIKMPLD